ncbi:MAG: hypothetical protein ACTSU5_01970 [Promethearchaeota archaeon]
MAIQPGSTDFYLILGLTLAVVLVKGVIATGLGLALWKHRKERGSQSFRFTASVALFMVFLMVARALYAVFDFSLTQFDSSLYVANVWWWKAATLSGQVGVTVVVFSVDRDIMGFKFHGGLAIVAAACTVAAVAYPVNTLADFDVISAFVVVVGVTSIVVPVVLFHVGWENEGVRQVAWVTALGIVVYMVGATFVNEVVLGPLSVAYGEHVRVTAQLLSTSLKVAGLSMLAYGVLQFKV